MKYNEAFDMILDGGEAYRSDERDIARYIFLDTVCGGVMEQLNHNRITLEHGVYFRKVDFTATDWIVEKDGVVYEEYQMPLNEKYKIDAKTVFEAALHEASLRIKRLEQEVTGKDEGWLEKKMLCFLSRHVRTNPCDNLAMHYCEQKDCGISKCPFCFPEKKADHIPDANNIIEQTREKVTVEDILYLINGVVGAEIADTMALFCPNYDEETRTKMRKGSAEALDSWGSKLKQKLEYLVSLQEIK